MALQMDGTKKLGVSCSLSSVQDERESFGLNDLDSEDGTKYDPNLEDFMSSEEEELRNLRMNDCKDIDLDFSFQNQSLLPDEIKNFVTEMRKQVPEGSLERAASLVEGIRILRKSQEENWSKMHDLILKKDILIKQMADIMKSYKTKISPTKESGEKNYGQFNYCSSSENTTGNHIPEKEMNESWDQEDSISVLGDLSIDDISEVSTDDISDAPILDVPLGYGDNDIEELERAIPGESQVTDAYKSSIK